MTDMTDMTDASGATTSSHGQPPASAPLHARILGTHMVVSGLTEALRSGLAELLLPFLMTGDIPDDTDAPAIAFDTSWNDLVGVWEITRDGQMLMGLSDTETLLRYLEWQIIAAGLEQVEGCGVFHAGVLARGDATVLLQGESGAGKTTLTLGLIARGWLPVADDVAIIDVWTLGLRVFPRCFHVEHERERPSEARPRLEDVAVVEGHARPLRWASEGRQPTAIITIARDAEQPSSLTPLLRAEAAGALFHGAIRTRLSGAQGAELAARVAATVRYCGRLNNSDLSQALDLIETACAR
jgi:hypothetical protein